MTDADVLAALSDVQALALTMYGEARGDGKDGSSVEERVAVGCVARNRLRTPKRFGHTLKDVCLQPFQFSCWLPKDPNRELLMGHAYRMATKQPLMNTLLDETLYFADGIARGVVLDQTGGATLYLTMTLYKDPTKRPAWVAHATVNRIIGSQVFCRED